MTDMDGRGSAGPPRPAAGAGGLGVPPEGLFALVALQDAGTVTGAAARLHVSQPALTRQLQRLARAAGAPLLERRGRAVALSAAGLLLAAHARRMAADWEATAAAVAGQAQPPLRLGCGTAMALSLLPAGLGRLREEAPALAFRIRAADSAGVAAMCLGGDIDAGLVTTPPSDRRLAVVPLGRDPLCAVAAPGGASRLGLAELASGPLCLYARGTGFRQFVDELFAGAGLRPRAAAEMDSMEALRELVAAGLGRSLLPRSVVSAALRAGRLQAVHVPDLPPAARTIALVRRADREPHPAFERLAGALRAAARDLLPPAAGPAAAPSERPEDGA